MSKVLQKTLFYIIILSFISYLIPAFTVSASTDNKSGYVVIEQTSKRVLSEKNKDLKLPMASTTKIVTALVVLEHADLSDKVIIPKCAEGVEGSSIYIKAGETYTVEDLLYGLMLRSGNDSAVALAMHVSGSIEKFCSLMNEKAIAVGATNTNFVNPHGLHDQNHYTTAYDLALLTAEAYNNENFIKIVSSKKYKLKDSYIYNKNKLLGSYEGADGVKTGYTTKSGRCLVSSSKRDGMRVICVVLNYYDMWDKSKELMTTAHKKYDLIKVLSKDDLTQTNVINGIKREVKCSVNKDFYYPLTVDEISSLSYEKEVFDTQAPVYSNQICGTVKVYLDKCLIFEKNIYTIENVRKKTFLDWLNELTNIKNFGA